MLDRPPNPPPMAASRYGNLRYDAMAGFFVFLIAVPHCLAVAQASAFSPVVMIWTAILGGLLCSLFSNSQLGVKGPAASLCIIVLGAATELSAEFGTSSMSEAEKAWLGYRLCLGIGVAAGILQILCGLLRAGRLADLVPLTPVHGMLAGIGIIIVAQQLYVVFGLTANRSLSPLQRIAEFPQKLRGLNLEIAIIGISGLAILAGFGWLGRRFLWAKLFPAPLAVVFAAIGLAYAFNLEETGPKFLVNIPSTLDGPFSALALPDFSGVATATGVKYLLLFTIVGSLKSLLSTRAVDMLDPWRRRTNYDRDLLATGLANTLSAATGGMPMITLIMHSKTNIDSGARTRASSLFRGLYLLAFAFVFPGLIHHIPLAALAAILVFTGLRLATPQEFIRTYRIGSEQFVVFLATILATLATDFVTGIGIGIALEVLFHLWNGASLRGFFRSDIAEIASDRPGCVTLAVGEAALFSNRHGLRRALLQHAAVQNEVILDLSATRLVDHSIMEMLNELEREFAARGKLLRLQGLEGHQPLSDHPLAARRSRVVLEPTLR